MLLSVIVPVYNAELTLDECVGSVLGAQSRDFELILVNDGSRDGSAAMCDAFAARDARVVVIHQENQGPACARNAGIRKARGDYLVHLDCDDFLLEGWFSTISSEILNHPDAEGLVWSINQYLDGVLYPESLPFPDTTSACCSGREAFHVLFCSNLGTLWQTFRYVVKRQCVANQNLFFRPGVLHEDLDFNPYLVVHLNSMHFCSNNYYAYRKGRPGSITASYSAARCRDMMEVIGRWEAILPACGLSADTMQRFRAVLSRLLWDAAVAVFSLPPAQRRPLYGSVCVQTRLLRQVRAPRWSACGKRLLLQVLGPCGAAWFMARYRARNQGRRTA